MVRSTSPVADQQARDQADDEAVHCHVVPAGQQHQARPTKASMVPTTVVALSLVVEPATQADRDEDLRLHHEGGDARREAEPDGEGDRYLAKAKASA